MYSYSVDHSSVPIKSAPVRGETKFSSMCAIKISNEPLKCLYCTITQNHIKGSIPVSALADKAPAIAQDIFKKVLKGLAKIKSMK
jgi:hypothetical protein